MGNATQRAFKRKMTRFPQKKNNGFVGVFIKFYRFFAVITLLCFPELPREPDFSELRSYVMMTLPRMLLLLLFLFGCIRNPQPGRQGDLSPVLPGSFGTRIDYTLFLAHGDNAPLGS